MNPMQLTQQLLFQLSHQGRQIQAQPTRYYLSEQIPAAVRRPLAQQPEQELTFQRLARGPLLVRRSSWLLAGR